MAPVNDNEDILLEDAARHAYAACSTAVVNVLPDGEGFIKITEPQAHGVMLGMVAATCSWTVSTAAALGKPFDVAKAEMLAAFEDHWGQAVLNIMTKDQQPN